MITKQDVDNWFTYHAPVRDQQSRYSRVNTAAKDFCNLILEIVQEGDDRDAALRSLRRLRMDVNLAIACEKEPGT
jgi:hypothetical protein